MATEETITGYLVENVSNTVGDIVKQEVYKQYGLEVSLRLRWINDGATWVYDVMIENVDKKQFTLVSEFAYGIVKGIRAYLNYEG